MMEMDLVETAKPAGVDTYKCLNFREACVGSREDQTPEPPAHPPAPSHPLQSGRCTLQRGMFKYQGEEMKQDELPHHRPVCLFCPSLPPSCFSSLSRSFALLSLLSPSQFFSASPWLYLFPFDRLLPLFTFLAVCGCAEIEDSLKCLPRSLLRRGEGGNRVCVWLWAPSPTRAPHN